MLMLCSKRRNTKLRREEKREKQCALRYIHTGRARARVAQVNIASHVSNCQPPTKPPTARSVTVTLDFKSFAKFGACANSQTCFFKRNYKVNVTVCVTARNEELWECSMLCSKRRNTKLKRKGKKRKAVCAEIYTHRTR
jgi:hypothetical protein